MWLWGAIVRSKGESCWSTSIQFWYLKTGTFYLHTSHDTSNPYCNCNSEVNVSCNSGGFSVYSWLNLGCVMRCFSTGRSTIWLNCVHSTSPSEHTFPSPCGGPAERNGLIGGVGSPGEMTTTSWVSSGEVRICWWEESPGPVKNIVWEPFGLLTTSVLCCTQTRNTYEQNSVWTLLLSCPPVCPGYTPFMGGHVNLLAAVRITRSCGGASDEKAPNLFKAGPVGSGVPPTSSSLMPQLQKGLIQGGEWGHWNRRVPLWAH